MKNKPSIVFFGTGQTSLDSLVELSKSYRIEAIFTKPADVISRGRSQNSKIIQWADTNDVMSFKTQTKKELGDVFKNNKFISRVGVVLDYGVIIPDEVISLFQLGILNSHFSLLPKYRGADPIRAAILSGDKITGVTIMKIVSELDAGPIISWAEYKIPYNITEPKLRTELSILNCALLPISLELFLDASVTLVEQDTSNVSFTKKISKQDGYIDCNKPANQIEREIRAYSNWPKSHLKYKAMDLIIHEAKVSSISSSLGKLTIVDNKLILGCKNSSLEIVKLQIPGKKPIDANSFINGYSNLLS